MKNLTEIFYNFAKYFRISWNFSKFNNLISFKFKIYYPTTTMILEITKENFRQRISSNGSY